MTPFRRYTNLAATIHMLRTRNITLLNPATWDDRNDAYFMAEYKRFKNAKAVLALCFAEYRETYHHWRVFSHGSDGICIQFDKEKLLSTFAHDPQVRMGSIQYMKIKDLRAEEAVELEELPFLKREPYNDEREFRVVYVDTDEPLEFQDYELNLEWIERITLSPWISKSLANSVKQTLRSIDGCSKLQISRSTLVDNEMWKKMTARVKQEVRRKPLQRNRT
jgi:hypothetical protein